VSEQPTTDPAARLTAAATHLRALLAAVPPPPWALGGIGDYGWTVHMGNPASGPFESLDTRMDSDEGKALARFIAAMGPLVGEKIAALLDSAAFDARMVGADPAAMALADAILAGGGQ
jgi:hypothetical protein